MGTASWVFLVFIIAITLIASVQLILEIVYVSSNRFQEATKSVKYFKVANDIVRQGSKNKVLKLLATRSFSVIAIILGLFTISYVMQL